MTSIVRETMTAEERYISNLEMVTTGKSFEEGKAERIAYLTGMLFPYIRKGTKRVIVEVPVEYFAVCRLYQTEYRTERDLKQLESKFDWNQFGVVTATLDLKTGTLNLTDGQGRVRVVAKKFDKAEEKMIPVMVILDVPEDYAERIVFESKLFTDQNLVTRKIKPNEKLEAEAEQGDIAAINLLNLFKVYNIERQTEGALKVGHVRDTVTYKRFVSKYGYTGGDWFFHIYRESGFDTNPNAYARQYARMLTRAYAMYPEYRKEIGIFCIEYLRGKTTEVLDVKADEAGYSQAKQSKFALYLEDQFTEALGIKKLPREQKGTVVA